MHPIERLRHVARVGGADHRDLVRETAAALGGLGDDHGGLVLSCKRLLDRQPTSGPLWWLCARLLCAADVRAEAWRCADELDDDPTSRLLADALPDGATITVLGWPEVAAEALPRRGDLEVLVVDVQGEGRSLARRLAMSDVDVVEVDEPGLGAAAAASDVVVVEASALGPDGLLAPAGSLAAAAVGAHVEAEVWAVAGVGRALPARLWAALTSRLDDEEPWAEEVDRVPLDLIGTVVGPGGTRSVAEARGRADCPAAPELLALVAR